MRTEKIQRLIAASHDRFDVVDSVRIEADLPRLAMNPMAEYADLELSKLGAGDPRLKKYIHHLQEVSLYLNVSRDENRRHFAGKLNLISTLANASPENVERTQVST